MKLYENMKVISLYCFDAQQQAITFRQPKIVSPKI